MTTLLTFRDNIKAFFSRYDYIITPVLKFFLAMFVFFSLNSQFGYMPILGNGVLIFLLSLICAFVPVEVITGIGAVMIVLQSTQVSIDVALISIALIVIFYCAYMRFVPKAGIITFLIPICYSFHLIYALPVVLGFLVGPVAIVPAIFGIILYYYGIGLEELVKVLAACTEEEDAIQGFQYILSGLLDNKLMLLTMVIFAAVILITYIIYRSSFENSWIIAFLAGGFLNVVLFLVGSVTLSIDVKILPVLLGGLSGILIAVLIQFGKGIVDYQRTEILQFEDDDYYYYVKAIPKLSVSESNKNVKHINSKTHN